MCEYARRILNNAERSGVTTIEPQLSSHSRIRRSPILDGSEMENRKCWNHNWKRNWSTKQPQIPPPPTPSLVESLLQRVLCRVDLLLGLKEYALPLPVQLCRIYGGLTVWKCQRAFISLLLKHEVCHHCSDLFPCEGIALVDFENPCFWFWITLAGVRYEIFTQAGNAKIPTRVSKIHGAGYLICKWDWKILADSAVLCWVK